MMPKGKRRELTPELVQTICEAIEQGNTRECAAQAVGASPDWLYHHMRRNPDFQEAIARADALAEQHHVKVIQTSARKGNANAAQWWLERRRAQTWGKVDRVEITIRQHAEKLAAELGLSADELIAEAERILKGAA